MSAIDTANGAAAPRLTEEQTRQARAATLPIGSVDDILANGFDLIEELLEVPEWGCSVRIRTANANDRSRIKSAGARLDSRGKPSIDMAAAEATQFRLGVVEPKFNEMQVLQLREKSGPGFARVIAALDRLGGSEEKEALLAQRDFPGAED